MQTTEEDKTEQAKPKDPITTVQPITTIQPVTTVLTPKKIYKQKFRKDWLHDDLLKSWIRTIPGDEAKARCKYCKHEVKAKYQCLKLHANSKKHLSKLPTPKGKAEKLAETPSKTSTEVSPEKEKGKGKGKEKRESTTPNNRIYPQRFRKNWLQDDVLKDWIRGVPGDDSKARCKFCKTEVRAKYQHLVKHAGSSKHIKAVPAVYSPMRRRAGHLEGSIAMHLCCHSALKYCDHLIELCKINYRNGETAAKMSRTKCMNIIKFILCSYFEQLLRTDIGNSKYSLLLGNTYFSETKLLTVSVVYFSKSQNKIVSTYFGLIQLQKCDAENIAAGIKELLTSRNLDFDNFVGIGGDHASFATGIDNAVHEKLKEEVPSLILVRCVSHSLQFAISHTTSECLPSTLEYLVSETYIWFLNSSHRQEVYRNIYEALHAGPTPIEIPPKSRTRWLSVKAVVDKVIEIWSALRTHFEIAQERERCYTAEILYNLYLDEKNLAYLLFLQTILNEVQRVKELFRSKTVDKVHLLDDLLLLFGKIGGKIALPPCEIDLLTCDIDAYLNPKPHLGDTIEAKIDQLRSGCITIDDENLIRRRCQNFLLSLFKQMKLRLLDEVTHLQNLSLFSVKNILQPTENMTAFCEVFKYLGATGEAVTEAEYQLTKVIAIDWENKADTESFWREVIQYEDSTGYSLFEELGQCAVSALVLLHSNAELKKVFGSIDYVKSKLGVDVNSELLNAVLMIKFSLARLGKCCHSHPLPAEVIENIEKMTDDASFQRNQYSTEEECDILFC